MSRGPIPTGLKGSWSGGGSGDLRIRLQGAGRSAELSFSSSGPKSYRVSGTCATQAGKVTQTAEIYQTTANRYRGDFHNPEFDINGTISIVVNGRSMTATLTSTSGTGVLGFSR